MHALNTRTHARTDFVDITREVELAVAQTGVGEGVATIFVPHTTAGVTINENADPDVLTDMTEILDRAVPWEGGYRHGEGNAAAHAKASMMGSSIQVIVENGHLLLGTWQGIYFCEFDGPRNRQFWVSVIEA
jgi:secondary thiamine-phosphate synthase enzyme